MSLEQTLSTSRKVKPRVQRDLEAFQHGTY